MITLNYNFTDTFKDIELFDFLNQFDRTEDKPTDNADLERLCIYFINAYSANAVFADGTVVKCDGFNKLKSSLGYLLSLKRHTPWIYSMLEYAYRCN